MAAHSDDEPLARDMRAQSRDVREPWLQRWKFACRWSESADAGSHGLKRLVVVCGCNRYSLVSFRGAVIDGEAMTLAVVTRFAMHTRGVAEIVADQAWLGGALDEDAMVCVAPPEPPAHGAVHPIDATLAEAEDDVLRALSTVLDQSRTDVSSAVRCHVSCLDRLDSAGECQQAATPHRELGGSARLHPAGGE
jgi:hypothetical protein